MTMREFLKANRVRMTCEWADNNPNMIDPSPGMSHYRCTLRRGRKRMTVFFSMGSAHTREPEVADVLDCLASDSSSVSGASFEDWCADLGYDTDSRKAERTYKICQRQAEALEALLGTEAFETLLYRTERL